MTISVIIPTYNRADLLRQTVESVLQQSRVPDQIIVVDDGSTDDTAEVLQGFGERVFATHQANAGRSAARNRGLQEATGEYICFLDSDDLLLPHALHDLKVALDAHPEAALVYGRSQTIDGANQITEELWDREDYEGEVWDTLIEANFIRTPGVVLLRRAPLIHLGGFDVDTNIRASEDWELWLNLAEAAPLARLTHPVLQYRVHSSNTSANALFMHQDALRLLQKQMRRHQNDPIRYQKVKQVRKRYARQTAAYLLDAMRQKRQNHDHRATLQFLLQIICAHPDVLVDSCRYRLQQHLRRLIGGESPAGRAVLGAYHCLPRTVRVGIRRVLRIDSRNGATKIGKDNLDAD